LSRRVVKIGFIGAGSIGSLFGGYIASVHSDKSPLEVIFFGRRDHALAINRDGLRLSAGNKDIYLKNIRVFESVDEKCRRFHWIVGYRRLL